MRRTIFIMLLFLTGMPLCNAQRLPSWMHELPHPGNETYMYVREAGMGSTLAEAHSQALLRVFQSTANRLGRPFDADEVDFAISHNTNLEAVSRQYNIPINKVDQFEERLFDGTYRVWVLCQVAVSGNIQPVWDELRREGEANNWTSLAKSAVVPGLGQMGKGYTSEGALTLGGELLLVGTGIGCYFIAQHQLDVMRDATTAYADWSHVRNSYRTLQTVSYIAWCGAAVLYAFNLYRAFSMQPRRSWGLALEPSPMPEGGGMAPSLALTLHF